MVCVNERQCRDFSVGKIVTHVHVVLYIQYNGHHCFLLPLVVLNNYLWKIALEKTISDLSNKYDD